MKPMSEKMVDGYTNWARCDVDLPWVYTSIILPNKNVVNICKHGLMRSLKVSFKVKY